MTPEEKAEDLLLKYSILSDGHNHLVKECVLICVDEIIKLREVDMGDPDMTLDEKEGIFLNINYWNQVKIEINKL